METTGARGRIHISSDTAELLKAAGKEKWIEKRKGQIDVKGKGKQDTYWVKMSSDSTGSTASGSVYEGNNQAVESTGPAGLKEAPFTNTMTDAQTKKTERLIDWNTAVLKQKLVAIQVQRNGVDTIDDNVTKQLRQHVAGIASMYRNNAFHNFEVRFIGALLQQEASVVLANFFNPF